MEQLSYLFVCFGIIQRSRSSSLHCIDSPNASALKVVVYSMFRFLFRSTALQVKFSYKLIKLVNPILSMSVYTAGFVLINYMKKDLPSYLPSDDTVTKNLCCLFLTAIQKWCCQRSLHEVGFNGLDFLCLFFHIVWLFSFFVFTASLEK